MVSITPTTTIPNVAGFTPQDESHDLHRYFKEGRYALVWWHPQVLAPAACKTCGGVAEPLQLLMAIHAGGCDVIGLTYETPDRMRRYLQDIGVEYPILSVTEDAARAHGVAKVEGEPWQSLPHRVAFLVDEHGQVINRYDVHDATVFLRTVRDDVKAGPPPSKWEPPKRRFLERLLGQ